MACCALSELLNVWKVLVFEVVDHLALGWFIYQFRGLSLKDARATEWIVAFGMFPAGAKQSKSQ